MAAGDPEPLMMSSWMMLPTLSASFYRKEVSHKSHPTFERHGSLSFCDNTLEISGARNWWGKSYPTLISWVLTQNTSTQLDYKVSINKLKKTLKCSDIFFLQEPLLLNVPKSSGIFSKVPSNLVSMLVMCGVCGGIDDHISSISVPIRVKKHCVKWCLNTRLTRVHTLPFLGEVHLPGVPLSPFSPSISLTSLLVVSTLCITFTEVNWREAAGSAPRVNRRQLCPASGISVALPRCLSLLLLIWYFGHSRSVLHHTSPIQDACLCVCVRVCVSVYVPLV